jgi:cyanophycinase
MLNSLVLGRIRKDMNVNVILGLVLNLSLLFGTVSHAAKIFHTGNVSNVTKATFSLTCLAGGEDDDLWAEGWKQMLIKSGGGDVVIVRADGQRGGYEDWIFNDTGAHGFPKVDSVTTILLNRINDGNRADIDAVIRNAELVFFAGGDQANYFKYIKGTKMEAALNYALHGKRVPFGGTSAGMAILGDMDFTAKHAPSKKATMVTALDAMKNPTATYVDLNRGFLTPDFMTDVITDTHFTQRDRQGRLLSFMARAVYNNYGDINALNIKGIGADGGTAVCISELGQGKVYGTNSVHFLMGNNLIERVMAGTSLNWYAQKQAVKVYSIHGSQSQNASFDLYNWSGVGGQAKFWFVDGQDAANPTFGEY